MNMPFVHGTGQQRINNKINRRSTTGQQKIIDEATTDQQQINNRPTTNQQQDQQKINDKINNKITGGGMSPPAGQTEDLLQRGTAADGSKFLNAGTRKLASRLERDRKLLNFFAAVLHFHKICLYLHPLSPESNQQI